MLDLAISDYNAAIILYNNIKEITDDNIVNLACYHLEQAVEKAIKFVLENNGLEFPKSHNIESLISFAEANDVDLYLNDYIIDHAEMLSSWEAKTRYVLDYLVDIKKLEATIEPVGTYLDDVAKHETTMFDNSTHDVN